MITIERPQTQRLDTSKLTAGDIVHIWGARVLLTGSPTCYTGYDSAQRLTYAWRDMPIISGHIITMERMRVWTVQGNELARWDVERGPLGRSVDMLHATGSVQEAHEESCQAGCGMWFDHGTGASGRRGTPCPEGAFLADAHRAACVAWSAALELPESQ